MPSDPTKPWRPPSWLRRYCSLWLAAAGVYVGYKLFLFHAAAVGDVCFACWFLSLSATFVLGNRMARRIEEHVAEFHEKNLYNWIGGFWTLRNKRNFVWSRECFGDEELRHAKHDLQALTLFLLIQFFAGPVLFGVL